MKKHRRITRFHRKSVSLGASLALMTSPLFASVNVYNVTEGEGTRTVSTNLTDDDGSLLQKFGGGTLLLTGSSTYTGGTDIYGGTLTLSGSNASINHGSSDLWIEQGNLQITNGGFANSSVGVIGTVDESIASASVTGNGSQWINNGWLLVGNLGQGSLTISNGGYVSNGYGNIGYEAGSTGQVVVTGSGSEWNVYGDLSVGTYGTGSLMISNGGYVNTFDDGTIAEEAGSTGHVLVTGSGSHWNIEDDDLTVGNSGTGSLTISNGGYVSVYDDATIGDNVGSTGQVLVTGSGSLLAIGSEGMTRNFHIGDLGSGSLTISNGGTVIAWGDSYLGHSQTEGGEGPGLLPGSDNVVRGKGDVLVTGSGSEWHTTRSLVVGFNGDGSLTIANGGVVTSFNAYIGDGNLDSEPTMGGSGSVLVTGRGSFLEVTDALFAGSGSGGTGTLVIADGGQVNSGAGIIGVSSGSEGSVLVTGRGSTWLAGNFLSIGQDGTGSLVIADGGYVKSEISGIGGGGYEGKGSVLVTGKGSLWESGGFFTIGTYGEGSLTISNGGMVRILTSGSGNEIAPGGTVYLGGNGVGTLNIGSAPGEAATGAGYLEAFEVVGTSGSNPGFSPTSSGTINFNHTSKDYTFTPLIYGGIIVNHFSGETTLVGDHDYYGGTNIYGGSLLVDGRIQGEVQVVGGMLGGDGFIAGDVFNHSVVNPGHSVGTLTVAGTYTQTASGAYLVEINKRSHDLLGVWGTAYLDGSLLLAYQGGYTPKKNHSYTILVSEEGVEGKFSKIKNLTPTMLKPKVSYDAHNVFLSFEQGKFSDVSGLTPNQKAVAKGLDSILNKRGARRLIDKLNTLPLGDIPNTLSLLSPEQFAAIFNIGFATSQIQFGNIERRLEDARNGASGFSANGLALSNSRGALNYNGMPLVNEKKGLTLAGWDGKSVVGKQAVAPIISASPWSFFATGTGEWADVETTGNARGSEFTTGGITLGADYRVNPNLVVGLTAGYTNTSSDLFNGGEIELNSGRIGAYATVYNDGLFLNALVGGAYNSYDTKRSSLGGNADGSTHGGEFDALLGGGYEVRMGGFAFGPVASLQYTYIGLDSFTESGSDAPLHIKSQSQNSLKSTLGLKASYAFNIGGVVITPEVRAQWLHEYLDSTAAIESSFAAGGSTFTTRGPSLGRDGLLLNAGVTAQFNPNLAVFAYYTGDIGRSNYNSNSVNGGFRISF